LLDKRNSITKETAIKLFNERRIRTQWNEDQEKWYFSIVDVVGVLTESENPNNYWKVLKNRLKKEGSELVTNCNQLKMESSDGKFYKTDVADTEQLFRLIQSIPSPKAEPFKMWLAQVGRERIDEIEDPEIGIDRLMETYMRKGYTKEWINQRLKSIEIRKELTDEWENRGVKKGQEYVDKERKVEVDHPEFIQKANDKCRNVKIAKDNDTLCLSSFNSLICRLRPLFCQKSTGHLVLLRQNFTHLSV
jgi:hypothetical protein